MNENAMGPFLTGIGGLPQTSLEEALDHILGGYDRVFRPQLPIGDGASGMLAECLPPGLALAPRPGFGVKLESLLEDGSIATVFRDGDAADAPLVASTRAFLAALPADLGGRGLKSQLAGPVTLLQSLRDAWSRPLFTDPALHEVVAAWCARLAALSADLLLDRGVEVTIVLDEPVIGLPGPRDQTEAVARTIRPVIAAVHAAGARSGLHCCSEPPLELLVALGCDDLLLDARRFASTLIAGRDLQRRHLARGARLTLGVTSPVPDEAPGRVLEILDALVAGGPLRRRELVAALALSPCCGTLLVPLERELDIVAELEAERDRIRDWMKEEA